MAIDLRQFITPSSINVDDGNLFSGNKIDENVDKVPSKGTGFCYQGSCFY